MIRTVKIGALNTKRNLLWVMIGIDWTEMYNMFTRSSEVY